MERQTRTRRAPDRVRAGPTNKSLPNTRRRVRIIRRRNRQLVPRRNRLERAQNNRIRNGRTRMFRKPNNFNRRDFSIEELFLLADCLDQLIIDYYYNFSEEKGELFHIE